MYRVHGTCAIVSKCMYLITSDYTITCIPCLPTPSPKYNNIIIVYVCYYVHHYDNEDVLLGAIYLTNPYKHADFLSLNV